MSASRRATAVEIDRSNPKMKEFQDLWEAFLDEYLLTEKGQWHLRRYPEQRAEGRRNYEAILAKTSRVEDVTDLVLLKLLPHQNSQGNRERGAWISIAPAVTRDVKSWFEGAGWTNPADWPRVAGAILELIRASLLDDESFKAACVEFASLEFSKGFQAGILSPILNALAPERFLILNSRSRRTLERFAGARHSAQLIDYPALNGAGCAFLGEIGPLLKTVELGDALPSDVFDEFCHWYVAIRKGLEREPSMTEGDEVEVDVPALGESLGVAEPDVEPAPSSGGEGRETVAARREPALHPPYAIDDLLSETGFARDDVAAWVRILERKKQIVLLGPPGTGKTFLAQRLARLLVGGTRGFVETVQFHPACAYEDFVQGRRPAPAGAGLQLRLEEGCFLQFCREARRVADDPAVLIIDEINRADLARVFGELIFLLEYRGQEIPLAAGGKPFGIPGNVFLIGTMSTAGRSIARLDLALRRRFAFIRLRPCYEVLRRHLEGSGPGAESLLKVLRNLNALIGDPDYEVGISYFLRGDGDLRSHLPDIWACEIEPYLEEYFHDHPDRVNAFRWKELVKDRLRDWA